MCKMMRFLRICFVFFLLVEKFAGFANRDISSAPCRMATFWSRAWTCLLILFASELSWKLLSGYSTESRINVNIHGLFTFWVRVGIVSQRLRYHFACTYISVISKRIILNRVFQLWCAHIHIRNQSNLYGRGNEADFSTPPFSWIY